MRCPTASFLSAGSNIFFSRSPFTSLERDAGKGCDVVTFACTDLVEFAIDIYTNGGAFCAIPGTDGVFSGIVASDVGFSMISGSDGMISLLRSSY